MTSEQLNRWLETLGYSAAGASLHRADAGPPRADHPYAPELYELLRTDGAIRAEAVFDVEGTPTVCFLSDDGDLMADSDNIDRIRQRIWNQNLISIVLIFRQNEVVPLSVQRRSKAVAALSLAQASASGPYSASDIQSGEIQHRLPDWFQPNARVDHRLLENLDHAITRLAKGGVSRENAQYLMGQILFISYLEHRGIVSETYRQKCRVESLHDLIRTRATPGIVRLLKQLKSHFNGDFLRPDGSLYEAWKVLSDENYGVLDDFLSHVDLEAGQYNFWNYDFSFIPVELLSGIYESFLGKEQEALAAYYTPRHLANLVVDQVFVDSKNILEETIYDGACGSGILLTTAFRRLLGVAEAAAGSQLSLHARIILLEKHIFCSDVSETACRITAFSLYLSVLERLQPADIVELQENENVKLPRLLDRNLFAGERKGDFFSPENPLANSKRFSVFLSNPPWREPDADEVTSADAWAEKTGIPRSRRQLAADFAHHALDSLSDGGRLCLILPVSLFLAATSDDFIKGWLLRARPSKVINFGDLQQLLFENASHSCVVTVAYPRRGEAEHRIPVDETFEYWVPKSDISLAFGRLTLHSGDRHQVQTQAVWEDHQRLVTLMWGGAFDLALWARLRLLGTFGELYKGRHKRWVSRKGFHQIDNSVKPVSAEPLRKMRFIPIAALKGDLPVLERRLLQKFPDDIKKVARLSDELMSVFHGPRILFPDGFSAEDRKIRAVFTAKPGSFTSSVGVVAGPAEDEDLLRFAAVYLRSDLVRYFLLTHAFQVLTERNRVTLLDVEKFPFVTPEGHSHPEKARRIVRQVADITRLLEEESGLLQTQRQQPHKKALDKLLYDYFDLDEVERVIVQEAVEELLPAVRPRSYKKLHTLPQQHASMKLIAGYANRLRTELEAWRTRLGGVGGIAVQATVTPLDRIGPWGIVRVTLTQGMEPEPTAGVKQGDLAVLAVMNKLQSDHLLPMAMSGEWYFVAETIIWSERDVYLIRPLARRFWLQRTGLRDALRIVEAIQNNPQSTSTLA